MSQNSNQVSDEMFNEELTDEEVDQLRKSWEIEDHWVLRRDFIVTHKSKYSLDRLLCLAQLFVNIEVLGNEYDPKLMEEISVLAKDLNTYEDLKRKKCKTNE